MIDRLAALDLAVKDKFVGAVRSPFPSSSPSLLFLMLSSRFVGLRRVVHGRVGAR